jgi:serine/threonine-protein kinase
MPKREQVIIEGVTYELESTLGDGGSGVVWKSRRMSDGAVFAVKRITKDPEAGSTRNQRFEQEIEFGRLANHPNVVKIRARSEDPNFFYYVMDIYPKTLRDVIMNESDAEVLLNYTLQLCGALAYVHGGDIVHRDIKPENVLVDPDTRQLVLADFGIAHFKDSVLTMRDDLLVNRNYLAPEQMVRNNAHAIGKPADIYSLGLVITELFTKQNARGRLHALIRDSYPFLADLDLIVGQMLLQDETQRLPVDTVLGLIRIAWQRFESAIEVTGDELRPNDLPGGVSREEVERVLGRAARDVLSAKHIFERVPDHELSRYNLNYHCEIAYRVSQELFNTCVQALVFAKCKAKFVYEGAGSWDKRDDASVSSASKPELLRELHLILNDFPLPKDSLWNGMSRQTGHLFRFLKDYHCRELLTSIRESVYEDGICQGG